MYREAEFLLLAPDQPRWSRPRQLPGMVTGSVPDVRPYLAYASLAVAPLRIARGIQNKVLEAMAMGKIVVASSQAMEGIDAVAGQELVVAENESDFVEQIVTLLSDGTPRAIGAAARRCALERYSWKKNLTKIDALIVQAGKDGEVRAPIRPEGTNVREMRV